MMNEEREEDDRKITRATAEGRETFKPQIHFCSIVTKQISNIVPNASPLEGQHHAANTELYFLRHGERRSWKLSTD